MNHPRHRSRAGVKPAAAFTLVELLVVIGIIATLVGILLPALAAARGRGELAVCHSNVRQLVTASATYAVDHLGYWPVGARDMQTANLHRWFGTRATAAEAFGQAGGSLSAYLGGGGDGGDGGVRACPGFVPAEGVGFERAAGGYGYNLHHLGSSAQTPAAQGSSSGPAAFAERYGNRPARMVDLTTPTETIAFADAAMPLFNGLAEYSFLEPPTVQAGGVTLETSPSVHFRHARYASVAWADGHVTAEPFGWTRPTNVYGQRNEPAGVGYPGDEAAGNRLFDRE
ncbi:MAG: type II secretion system protein [Phycisphaerae bacterium]